MNQRALQIIVTVLDPGDGKRPMRIDALWQNPPGEPQPCTDPAVVLKALNAALTATFQSVEVSFPALIQSVNPRLDA